jgi:hypothetical protein
MIFPTTTASDSAVNLSSAESDSRHKMGA